MKIEKLTPEQQSRFPEFVDKWLKIGLCTDPANRTEAEKGINLAYEIAGLEKPKKIVWCASPLSMAITCSLLKSGGVGASVGDIVMETVYGQHDAGWLSFYDYFREVADLENQTEKLAGLNIIANSAGWWIPGENICFVSERHNICKVDYRGFIHCEDGPAIEYPDGFSIYACHGVRVPE